MAFQKQPGFTGFFGQMGGILRLLLFVGVRPFASLLQICANSKTNSNTNTYPNGYAYRYIVECCAKSSADSSSKSNS